MTKLVDRNNRLQSIASTMRKDHVFVTSSHL